MRLIKQSGREADNLRRYQGLLARFYDVGEGAILLDGQDIRTIAEAELRRHIGLVLQDNVLFGGTVLDEATSAVDTLTERRIQQALRRLCEGRTAIIIAHRLATIRDADRIAVIRDGTVAETGSHDELLGRAGAYAALYDAYRREHEAAASDIRHSRESALTLETA